MRKLFIQHKTVNPCDTSSVGEFAEGCGNGNYETDQASLGLDIWSKQEGDGI